jgi:hypothetical protein
MTRASGFACHAMQLMVLRSASLIVPVQQREEWYREWASELWHARRSRMPAGASGWIAERELTSFCMGSFQDAAYMRGEEHENAAAAASAPTASVPRASVHGSARRCVLWLSSALALCAVIGQYLPGVQNEKDAARIPEQPGAILIEKATSGDAVRTSIPFAQYRHWKTRRQRFFADLAFYRTAWEHARVDGMETDTWLVAHASENVFAVLGSTLSRSGPDPDGQTGQAFLSPSLWRRTFDSDPSVIGQVMKLGGRSLRIAGVAPAGVWQLPDHPDLWILEPDSTLGRGSQSVSGRVIGLLSRLGQAEVPEERFSIWANSTEDSEADYRGVRFAPRASGPWAIFVFAVFLAVLALPAITSVFQSESNFASHPPTFKTRAKRWIFLVLKLCLVAALAYFAAVDIAYGAFADYSPSAEFLQFAVGFTIALFGFRWAIIDQSRRCPVCLRCVTHPARVGIASCNFLSWNGTEMICTGGHALLHVPSLPTSWFSRQRWMYLDTSWGFLFADAVGRPQE